MHAWRTCARRLTRVREAVAEYYRRAGERWNEEAWLHHLLRAHRRGIAMEISTNKYLQRFQRYVCEMLGVGDQVRSLNDPEDPQTPERVPSLSQRRESSLPVSRQQPPPGLQGSERMDSTVFGGFKNLCD